MSDLQGLPDLAAPVGAGYAAFGRDGLVIAVPDRLTLLRGADGRAELLVTLERSTAFEPVGRLELALAAVTGGTPADDGADVVPAEPTGGVLNVTVQLGATVREQFLPPLSLAPDQVGRGRVVAVLPSRAATLAARLVEDATLPVTASLRLSLRAVAPRLPFTASFDPRRLATRLADRFGVHAAIEPEDLGAALDELLGGPDDVPAEEVRSRREALVLRLSRLTFMDPDGSLRLRLLPPELVPEGTVELDMSRPAGVTVHRLLAFDPFAEARALAGGSLERYVRRVTVPELPTGHTPVTVLADLPEPIAGLRTLVADLRVPPAPPKRPHQIDTSLTLAPPDRAGTTTLVLAPGEVLRGEVRLRALLAAPDGDTELAGTWRPAETRHLLLGRGAFPLPLIVVRADAALLRLATVQVLTESGRLVGRLEADAAALAVPWQSGDRPATLVITPVGEGRVIELPVDEPVTPDPQIDLNLATLPGAGGHRARVVSTAPPVTVQWRPEDGKGEAGVQSVLLTAVRPQQEIRWTASSPFRPGVRWRVVRGGVPGPWSQPVAPADDLVITVDEPETVVVDGVELRPDRGEPGLWAYLPPGPFLERDAQGRAAIGLLTAGDVAFLQVTVRMDLAPQARAALAAALRGRVAGPVTDVRPAPVEVRRVSVQVRTAGGDWQTLTEGAGSGLPPWTAALSAQLTAEQADAVRAALDGAHDRLRLTGEQRLASGGRAERSRDVADLLRTN
ncbi:hypothetical protein SAMN04489712_11995 [Thermomonospora echinospora]|uniref:Uncharacterized protein n=1 Tax=Thermomonospora echinospora TaxID=1992 RepID=A0A1H6DMJ7_9ACTN|nr:hypothetical protein [Thermomonospora echinospora]SEG86492.1 hypothetical protein SAMN04489712_11995 [Thermomonospora echinospora]